jgi:hypothetical protein
MSMTDHRCWTIAFYTFFFILFYYCITDEKATKKKTPAGKQIEQTHSNLLLGLSTHTLVIIICIQNERESNTSREEKKRYI